MSSLSGYNQHQHEVGIIRRMSLTHAKNSLSTSLKSETRWFGTGLVAAFVLCLLFNLPFFWITVYTIGYVVWLIRRMAAMVRWLSKGAKAVDAPLTTGLTDDMVQLIHREKKYSRKQKNRYRSTLAQFNSLASDLPDATVVLNKDQEIRWSNAAALALLNVHPERDRGQRIDNLIRMPEFREFLLSDNDEDELETPSPAAPGRVLIIRKVRTGKYLNVLIAADVTQRVHVREMRKAFVGDVSHELRTPLTVIRGYLEMLREIEPLDPEIEASLAQITAQSDRMQGIVEDLLQLSKLEGNPLADNEGETVDINRMIESMVAAIKEVSPTHEFVMQLDPSVSLLCSESEIYSACNNLLTNAVRYTQSGARVTLSWQVNEESRAVFCVSDNGPGIEPRHLSRLSERFYRVDTGRSRDDGGTGLGLAIVKHAAQRHGGTLNIRSIPGTGSDFEIVFPQIRTLLHQNNVNS